MGEAAEEELDRAVEDDRQYTFGFEEEYDPYGEDWLEKEMKVEEEKER